MATEIGGLADQSKQTVTQIQKVTEEVTTSVAQLSSDAEQLLAFVGNDVVASYDMFDAVADAYNQDAGKIDALISDFSATSEELLASIDGVLDAMEGIATATKNDFTEGTADNDTDRHVHHIATHGKLLEFLQDFFHSFQFCL